MNWAALLAAVSLVESGGDPRAHNVREDARGELQVRQCVVTDVNRRYGTRYTLAEVAADRQLGRADLERWPTRSPEGGNGWVLAEGGGEDERRGSTSARSDVGCTLWLGLSGSRQRVRKKVENSC